MKRNLITWTIVFLFFGLLSGMVEGAEYCVSNSTEIQNALTASEANNQADVIRIVQGTYTGNFTYNSSEPFGLTIEGRYSAGTDCSSRTAPPRKYSS